MFLVENLEDALAVLKKEVEVCTRIHVETETDVRTGALLTAASVLLSEVAAECCVLCGKVCDRLRRDDESLEWFGRAGLVKADSAALISDSRVSDSFRFVSVFVKLLSCVSNVIFATPYRTTF